MCYGIAIEAINGVAKCQKLEEEDKLILLCEFISSQDLDKDFIKYLKDKFTENKERGTI